MEIFLFDVPLMIILGAVSGYIYAKKLINDHPDSYFFIAAFFIGIFWLNALLSFLGVIEPWLVGRLITRINPLIGLFYILSYPLWFYWGAERSYQLWGRTPEQGGMLWLFTIKDKTKPFRPTWE